MAIKYKIKIFPKAQKDMEEIFHYISNTLMNKEAAITLINKFIKAVDNLSI